MKKSFWILVGAGVVVILAVAWALYGPLPPGLSGETEGLTYTNEKYGFAITVPEVWRGFRVRESTSIVGEPEVARFEVGFATADLNWGDEFAAPVMIQVFEPEAWQVVQGYEGPKPGFLGQNNKYVFAFMPWQDVPSDLEDKAIPLDEEIVKGMFRVFPAKD